MSPKAEDRMKRKQTADNKKDPVKIARTAAEDSEMVTSICFLVCTHDEYRCHKVNVNDVTGDEPQQLPTTSLLCSRPFPYLPSGFSCLHFDSKLYFIGGTEHKPGTNFAPSSAVHIFNINTGKWEFGTRMLGGKFSPTVSAVDGKIYVFDHILAQSQALPWAEVYDPTSDQWDGIPYPPYHQVGPYAGRGVLHEQDKTFLLNFDDGQEFVFFDTKSNSWSFNNYIIYNDIDVSFLGKPLIADNHLFFFDSQKKKLLSYDLAGGSDLLPVTGLQIYTDLVPDGTLTFLNNLGDGNLCLVWSFDMLNDCSQIICQIRCLKFQPNKTSQGYSAIVRGFNSYFTEDALGCMDSFTIKHTTISDMEPGMDTAQDISQGSQERAQTTNGNAQVTRNARRVYVEGYLSDTQVQPLKKDIEKFFNTVSSTYSPSAAPVVSVYFNEDRKFAIVEMRTEEEARDALKLDCPFQGSKLKISRPTDYLRDPYPWYASPSAIQKGF